jgi:hypothetical protein
MNRSNTWQGAIAMQRRRLAQLELLVVYYTNMIRESGDYEKFSQALERAMQRRDRIQNWLSVHSQAGETDEPSEKVQAAFGSLI